MTKQGLILLHQGAIGDFVLTLSVLQAVRAHGGFEHVLAIASAVSAKASAGRSAIDEWKSPEAVGLHSLYLEAGPIDERLRGELDRAELVLNFLGDERSGPHRRLADCCRVISVDPRPNAETERSRRHITEQWAEAIRSAGFEMGEPTPAHVTVDPAALQATAKRSGRQVVIHPGSGGREKCWPVENFIRVADALGDARISWVLGPAELESRPFDVLRQRTKEDVVCEPELLAAMQRMAGARLYIGNDAGMTHVAAAMGLPTIAIFGPTDPRIWRPLGDHVRVVEPPARVDQVLAAVNIA